MPRRPGWVLATVLAALAALPTAAPGKDHGANHQQRDPGSLPNLDLDPFYPYGTALGGSEPTLLASTLDGHLVALGQETGDLLWDIKDEPVVKSPYDSSKPVLPAFLPDPKDGSIYMIGGGLKDPLKKLPFTIPELVAASPCKSSDGILYTGKKVDTWISVDRHTGDRQGTISFNGCLEGANDQCPKFRPANVLIGRTEYNIMMFDSRVEGRRWNISFFDYSSNLAGADVGADYGLAHFTDSSSGNLVTLDSTTGAIQWERQIGSPVVALYRLEDDGIVSVPFTSVSKETMGNLFNQIGGSEPSEAREVIGETKLYKTLYVGEHEHGLYAMPSLVDEETLTIAPSSTGPLLLEGPQNFQMPTEINLDVIANRDGRGGGSAYSEDPLGIPMGDHDARGDKSSVLLFANETVRRALWLSLPERRRIKKALPSKKTKRAIEMQKFAISAEIRERMTQDEEDEEEYQENLNRRLYGSFIIGYYQVPERSTIKLSPAVGHLQLTSGSSHHQHQQHKSNVHQQHRQRHPYQDIPHSGGLGPNGVPVFGGTVESDERGVITNVYPTTGGRVSIEEAERGLIDGRGKDGTSYSSAYYYYEVSPRDELEGDDAPRHSYDVELVEEGLRQIRQLNTSFITSGDVVRFIKELVPMTRESLSEVENKELKAIIILLVVLVYAVFKLYSKAQNAEFASSRRRIGQYSANGSANGSSIGATGGYYSAPEVTAQAVELEDGTVRVGSIFFDPAQILGKGCEGTFVFKGRFDNRDVAVKRVLNADISVADREVELLRESDEHPNVIRYFCMEQDRQFRYIALEFCQATLQDYVDGRYVNPKLDAITMLRQATLGLLHLHTLEIVHRDIKPHNVLISMPGRRGDVRAMISDFGLCKKLKVGRMSFSRRSGVAGTEGWIAPEMMEGDRSNTCAVDVFSLGCVYHFVLSRGHHPFGDSFHRQGNIQSGRFDLSRLGEREVTARSLVERMVQRDPSRRPPTQAVLRHPLFWGRERALAFLQDVSDRVDKEDGDAALVESLERGRAEVVRGNWHEWLDEKVQEDLRKHRTYNGRQVRDLLRALRNKKHHYNELPEDIKAMYGRIPDQFVDYWISRFPRLVVHSWHAMHSIKSEPTFQKYFDKDFDFLQDDELECDPAVHQSMFNDDFLKRQKYADSEVATPYRPSMSLSPESRRPPPTGQLFEPAFMRAPAAGAAGTAASDDASFFPTTNGLGHRDVGGGREAEEEEEEREGVPGVSSVTSSTVSKWEDFDSGRIDRMLGGGGDASPDGQKTAVADGEDGNDDDDDFHEMPAATQEEMNGGSNDSPLLLVPNGGDNSRLQHPLQQQQQQPEQPPQFPVSPKRRKKKVAQLSSEARQEELADLERRRAANKPSWSEALRNITADDKMSKLETTLEEEGAENVENVDPESANGDASDADVEAPAPSPVTAPPVAGSDSAEEEREGEPSEDGGGGGPKWVVDERVAAEAKKKTNKKKKKKKPSKAP